MPPDTRESVVATLHALINAGLTLHLYARPVEESPDLTALSFTEIAFPGYSPISLPPHLWTVETGSGDLPPTAYTPYQMFQRTAAGAPAYIHGWYVTDTAGRLVGWDAVPDAPWDMVRAVDAAQIQPGLSGRMGE